MLKLTAIFILIFCSSQLVGQSLHVDTTFSADHLVDKVLVGNGIRVGNVKITGRKQSYCYFSIDTNVIGMKSGILLSTGNVFEVARPNTSPGTSGLSWEHPTRKKYRSDKELDKLSKGTTRDHIILEFDFVPFNNNVSFNFSFASEEYTEYVGSSFNDIFAFMISGNHLKSKNIATLPGTEIPITINNLNHKKNEHLFIDNDYFLNFGHQKNNTGKPKAFWFRLLWSRLFNKKNLKNGYYILTSKKKKLNQVIVSNFEYDGFTKTLKADCILEPWKLYHLKIAVADVGDAIFDSGVFLEEGSFNSVKDTSVRDFKEYPDLSDNMNWDSIFKIKKTNPTLTLQEAEKPLIDEKFEVTDIHFNSAKYDIPDSSKIALDSLAAYLNKHKNFKLSIIGHTDNTGSKKRNLLLSENRALAVMNYLTSKGINKTRLIYVGNSFDSPVAANTDEKGRALNRRVELMIIDEEKD